MKATLILLGLLLVVVAGMFAVGSSWSGPAAALVPFTILAEGPHSVIDSRVNYLITTQEEFAALWELLKEPPPAPTVDFSANVVAAVFAGEAPTTGYAIAVAEVEDADSRIVKIELARPDESCVLAQSLTAPYQIIELPKTSLPFTHSDIWTTKACQ